MNAELLSGRVAPPPVMALLAAGVPLQLLMDLASQPSYSQLAPPEPATTSSGPGEMWVDPWALDPPIP